jgi:hypothetical protein
MSQFDFAIVFGAYFLIIFVLIVIYIYAETNRQLITGIVSILSGSTIALGLLNYMNNENTRVMQQEYNKRRDYIDFISSSFDKIDTYYLENPNDLHDLFYEFYGYSNFPINTVREKKERPKNNNGNNVTDIEYIVLLKIIQQINIMFITNSDIFEDLNFRNKIINYTRSSKFKEVLSYNKNNFSEEFINKLNELKIINTNEMEVEQITIPTLNNK